MKLARTRTDPTDAERQWTEHPYDEPPSVPGTRANLAYRTGEAGDAAGARDRLAALLPVAERVLSPEHPITLRARNYLAHWTRMAGGGRGSGMK